jgi:hypothetical protein
MAATVKKVSVTFALPVPLKKFSPKLKQNHDLSPYIEKGELGGKSTKLFRFTLYP